MKPASLATALALALFATWTASTLDVASADKATKVVDGAARPNTSRPRDLKMTPLNGVKTLQLTPGRRNVRITRTDGSKASLRLRKVAGSQDKFAASGRAGIYLTREMGSEQLDVISRLAGGGMLIDIFTLSGWLSETRVQTRHGMTITYANGDDTVKSISRQSHRQGTGRLAINDAGTATLSRYLPGNVEMEYAASHDQQRRSLTLTEIGGEGVVRVALSEDRVSWILITDELSTRGSLTWDDEAEAAKPPAIAKAVADSLAARPSSRASAAMQAQLRRLSKVAQRLGPEDPLHAAVLAISAQLAPTID